jgi:hypothetical protein
MINIGEHYAICTQWNGWQSRRLSLRYAFVLRATCWGQGWPVCWCEKRLASCISTLQTTLNVVFLTILIIPRLYRPNSMVQDLPWKVDTWSAALEVPWLCETRMLITVFRIVRHWTVSWARWIHPIPSYSVSLISILQCTPGSPSRVLHWGFQIRILYVSLIFPVRATCYTQLIPLDFIGLTISGEELKLWTKYSPQHV